MNLQSQPPTDPQRDLRYDQAESEFASDIRALNHLHSLIGWSLDITTGKLIIICGCDRRGRPAAHSHWADAVKAVRGPNPKPKRY